MECELGVLVKYPEKCLIEECGRKAEARGLCLPHWKRMKRAGRLDEFPRFNSRAGRVTRGSPYVRIWEPDHPLAMKDGYVMEHRKVLYDAGIDVSADCHVHHKNGNKHDNRLENLEPLDQSYHHRHHIAEAGEVVNQYGVFPVLTSEAERKARLTQQWAQNRARKRQKDAVCPVCGAPRNYEKKTCSRTCGAQLRRLSA